MYAVDVLMFILEAVILGVSVTSLAVAIPPSSAPAEAYRHVVTLFSVVVLAAVAVAQLLFLLRRRWGATAIQAVFTIGALASVAYLHDVRVSGGLTGY
jgi:hypothetical protein